MSPYCAAPLALTNNHDIIGACIQAEAGFAQATAATRAGLMTAGAGVFVLIAAGLAAWVTISTTRKQIAASHAEQETQRDHELKRQVFSKAMAGVGACFETMSLMANLTILTADAVNPFMTRMVPNALDIHLVADIALAQKWLRLVSTMGRVIAGLALDRPREQLIDMDVQSISVWSRHVTKSLPEIIGPAVEVLGELRKELGVPFDKDTYKAVLEVGLRTTLINNEEIYRRAHERNLASAEAERRNRL